MLVSKKHGSEDHKLIRTLMSSTLTLRTSWGLLLVFLARLAWSITKAKGTSLLGQVPRTRPRHIRD